MAFRVASGRVDLAGVPDWLLPVLRAAMARDPRARPRPAQLGSLVGRSDVAQVLGSATPRPAVPPMVGSITPRPTRQLTAVPPAAPAPQPAPAPASKQRGGVWSPVPARPLLSLPLLLLAAAAGAAAPFAAL
ncbi:MAG: hypothetical protein GEU92_21115, partial [Alphaproteobacteria bacterium]|nr:hypothetical protein [Alphaproteobacteria bacterium]